MDLVAWVETQCRCVKSPQILQGVFSEHVVVNAWKVLTSFEPKDAFTNVTRDIVICVCVMHDAAAVWIATVLGECPFSAVDVL